MSAPQFTPGQQVYDIHGRAGAYVARAAGGHIVEPMFEVDDDEPRYAEAQTWREVFAKPPTEKLHAEVAEIEQTLSAARAALDRVREERRQFDAEERRRLARLKQHQALATIEVFLDGKLPSFFLITKEYGAPSIVTAEEFVTDRNDYGRVQGKKLLCLLGDTKGDLQWKVNRYSDGSGNWTEVLPFDTEAEAVYELRRQYALHCEDWRAKVKSGAQPWGHKAISWVDVGADPRGWLTAPEDVRRHICATRLSVARDAHAKAHKALDEAAAALAVAEQAAAEFASPATT